MQYMFLIFLDPSKDAPKTTAPGQFDDWYVYTEALRKAGVHVAGEPLQASDTATTLRLKNNERVLTDGPFVETKEQLLGFYIVDTPNLDAALDWAAKMPHIQNGGVEVRPIMVFSPQPSHV